jgi:hypothetical protein
MPALQEMPSQRPLKAGSGAGAIESFLCLFARAGMRALGEPAFIVQRGENMA